MVQDTVNSDTIVQSRKLTEWDDCEPVLEDLLQAVGGLESRVRPGEVVLIKPNFVAPFPKATTDLHFIDFFIRKIREAGAIPVVGEDSGYEFDTEMTLQVLGVRDFLRERDVEMVNLSDFNYVKVHLAKDLPDMEVAELALAAGLIINLPVLKGHVITKMTG
ncbi:DUF362 domain-containing protein, partial [bacterium]|nr:DUF362 domain-containing protein [bacterium]